MTNLTDRVLAIMQTRFPLQFEIALLTAQNEALRGDEVADGPDHEDDEDE